MQNVTEHTGHYTAGQMFTALWEIIYLIKEIDMYNMYRGTALTDDESQIVHALKQDVEEILRRNNINFA